MKSKNETFFIRDEFCHLILCLHIMIVVTSLQSIAHHHWKKQQVHIEPQCTASGVAKKPGEFTF